MEAQERRLGKIKQAKISRAKIRAAEIASKTKGKKDKQENKGAAASEKFRSMVKEFSNSIFRRCKIF